MRISVIMPVNLGYYDVIENGQVVIKSASDPEHKFRRAINSFIIQSFKDAELIIVVDGCWIAANIYLTGYSQIPNIRYKWLDKQVQYAGIVRQTGIEMATGEIICYLDHDDMFGRNHLSIINENFDLEKYDWVYYDDFIVYPDDTVFLRDVQQEVCKIGTSSIAHKKNLEVKWGDGYGHDWHLVNTYLIPNHKCIKIPTPQYYVCHCSNTNVIY